MLLAVVVCAQWLQTCMQLDLSQPQHQAAAQAALQSLLDNIPVGIEATPAASAVAAAAAAAASPGGSPSGTEQGAAVQPAAGAAVVAAQAELIAAERHLRRASGTLQMSFEKQLQLRELVQQLLKLEPGDIRVQLFLTEYQVGSGTL